MSRFCPSVRLLAAALILSASAPGALISIASSASRTLQTERTLNYGMGTSSVEGPSTQYLSVQFAFEPIELPENALVQSASLTLSTSDTSSQSSRTSTQLLTYQVPVYGTYVWTCVGVHRGNCVQWGYVWDSTRFSHYQTYGGTPGSATVTWSTQPASAHIFAASTGATFVSTNGAFDLLGAGWLPRLLGPGPLYVTIEALASATAAIQYPGYYSYNSQTGILDRSLDASARLDVEYSLPPGDVVATPEPTTMSMGIIAMAAAAARRRYRR